MDLTTYHGVVGEIVYAYIVAHPDYGFAVALLSWFSTCPSQCHYDAAKRCLKSLIRTAIDGIWYWRRKPRMNLAPGDFSPRLLEDFEQKFPILHNPFRASRPQYTNEMIIWWYFGFPWWYCANHVCC
jgi:hypothetical protein